MFFARATTDSSLFCLSSPSRARCLLVGIPCSISLIVGHPPERSNSAHFLIFSIPHLQSKPSIYLRAMNIERFIAASRLMHHAVPSLSLSSPSSPPLATTLPPPHLRKLISETLALISAPLGHVQCSLRAESVLCSIIDRTLTLEFNAAAYRSISISVSRQYCNRTLTSASGPGPRGNAGTQTGSA